MTEKPDKKDLVLGLVTHTSPAKVASADPTDGRDKTDFQAMMRKGEGKDPIAGKALREAGYTYASVKLTKADFRRLKILAVIEEKSLSYYLTEAVEQYLERISARLPDIS
jgi:hypothetical protein